MIYRVKEPITEPLSIFESLKLLLQIIGILYSKNNIQ